MSTKRQKTKTPPPSDVDNDESGLVESAVDDDSIQLDPEPPADEPDIGAPSDEADVDDEINMKEQDNRKKRKHDASVREDATDEPEKDAEKEPENGGDEEAPTKDKKKDNKKQSKKEPEKPKVKKNPNDILRRGYKFDKTNGHKPLWFEEYIEWEEDPETKKKIMTDKGLYAKQRKHKEGSRREKIETALILSNRKDTISRRNPNYKQKWNITIVSPFMHITRNTGVYPLGTLVDAVRDELGNVTYVKGLDHRPRNPKDPNSTYAQGNTEIKGSRRKATVAEFIPEYKQGAETLDYEGMLKDIDNFFAFEMMQDNVLLRFTSEISCAKYVERIRAQARGEVLDVDAADTKTDSKPAQNDAATSGPKSAKGKKDDKKPASMQYFPEIAGSKCPIQIPPAETTCPLTKASVQEKMKWRKKNLPAVYAKHLVELEALIADPEKFSSWCSEVELALADTSHGGPPIFRYTVYEPDPTKVKKKTESSEVPIEGGAYTSGKRDVAPPPRSSDSKENDASITDELDDLKSKFTVHELPNSLKRTIAFTRPLCQDMKTMTGDNKPKPDKEYLSDDFLSGLWDEGKGLYVSPVPLYWVDETTKKFVPVPLFERELFPGDLAAFVFEANPSYDPGVVRNTPKLTEIIVYRRNPNPRRAFRSTTLDYLNAAEDELAASVGIPAANGGSKALVPYTAKGKMPTPDDLKNVFGASKAAEPPSGGAAEPGDKGPNVKKTATTK